MFAGHFHLIHQRRLRPDILNGISECYEEGFPRPPLPDFTLIYECFTDSTKHINDVSTRYGRIDCS